ncbi:DNA replication and repair protein RecF, partial [Faecalibacterium sp. DFI.5.82]|nr:DNA replication and repair protein RecF [Faecalibacterium sp. DFI.5.82]
NYEELSHGAERMELRYAAQFEQGGLAAMLKARQNEEVRAGPSLCGPHREDLELLLDGQPARVFASQGQQRCVVLSLKMAEASAAAAFTGEHPVILLDDVLSEL